MSSGTIGYPHNRNGPSINDDGARMERIVVLAAALCALLCASIAIAQPVGTPSEPEGAGPAAAAPPIEELETVIVSGSKQRENIQQIPFSVFVATASTLERAGIRDFDDLPRIAPSLTLSRSS